MEATVTITTTEYKELVQTAQAFEKLLDDLEEKNTRLAWMKEALMESEFDKWSFERNSREEQELCFNDITKLIKAGITYHEMKRFMDRKEEKDGN